jgi:predicted transcriptional regulator
MDPNTAVILNLLADRSSLEILYHIAKSHEGGQVDGTSVPITKTSLSRRQYYRRLSLMTKMELIVKKNNKKYNITLFGRLICAQIQSIEKLVDHYWKIKAIDSIKLATANEGNSDQQFIGLVNTLIQDHDVKRLLLSLYSLGTEKTDIITAKNGY